MPSLVTSHAIRTAQLLGTPCNVLCFHVSFSINIANGGLRTILNFMHSENRLSSCPKGTGYKEERVRSTEKRNWALGFKKFFSLKDTINLLGHALIRLPRLLLPVQFFTLFSY